MKYLDTAMAELALVGLVLTQPGVVSAFGVSSRCSATLRNHAFLAAALLRLVKEDPNGETGGTSHRRGPFVDDQDGAAASYTAADDKSASSAHQAVTGTVNERLLAELQQAADKEKFSARSNAGQKLGFAFRSSKTDAERKASIAEARDLNGVNPLVALAGSLIALGGAAGLWLATQYLAAYFALHPVETDVYFVARVAAVFRNVAIGLVSLASGFFGVTGIGILLLAVRVAYGVVTGELDPTPIKSYKKGGAELDVGNAWDLMLSKTSKRGRR